MKIQLILSFLLILSISIIAVADQQSDWPHEQRNVAPTGIEYVLYDFEEGSNCAPFKNQYPEVATFLTVLGTQPYGSDWPSYVSVGGSTCGNTRCYMKIYPWCGYYTNGTPYEWVFITNGRDAFSPMTGPDSMGGYWPGTKAQIEFKKDTRYVSFLACTGGNLYVSLYDRHGNRIHSEKITITIYRDGTDPSDWTRFSYYSKNTDIVSMKLSGPFNGWHIDDLIIGGAPGYLPDKPVDYSDVAKKVETLIDTFYYDDVNYLEYGFGYDYRYLTYADTEDLINPSDEGLEYWNPDTKQFEYGKGISDEGLILWAYNSITQELYGENVVKWNTAPDMAKHDFTESVPIGEEQPGDVYFMYGGEYGTLDEVGIVVCDTQVVTSRPGEGVKYHTKNIIETNPDGTPDPDFAGYYRLPGKITGGHNPIKKHPPVK